MWDGFPGQRLVSPLEHPAGMQVDPACSWGGILGLILPSMVWAVLGKGGGGEVLL